MGAVLTAVLLGFVWLILGRLFSRCMVWLTIWSLFLALIGAMLFFMDRAGWISLSAALSSVTATVAGVTSPNATALGLGGAEAALADFNAQTAMDPAVAQPLAITLAVIAGLYFFIICFMMKRIAVAIGIINEAAKAMAAVGITAVFWPLVGFLQSVINIVWFLIICLFLAALT